jgi:hypothetical protein
MPRLLPRRRLVVSLLGVLALTAGALLLRPAPARTAGAAAVPEKDAVDRTREQVKMLDDLYKSAIVHVTETYVKAQERTPAAAAAKKIFKDMASKGWHDARLVDATGVPANRKNLPKTEFEKRAIAKLKDGKPYYEELAVKNDRPVLRAATPVPVVMAQCIVCHPGFKEGDLLGAIVYELPIK